LPRKSTRHADEHRITLGDFERSELRKVVRFQQFGPLLQGAGFATLGVAGLIGSIVFMRYKAPDLVQATKNAVQTFVAESVSTLDSVADSFAQGERSPVKHRRDAQAFARRRNKLAQDIDYRCTHSSEGYDEQECSILHMQTKRDYFTELQAFNDLMESIYGDSAYKIYIGLGNIDPLKRAGSPQYNKAQNIHSAAVNAEIERAKQEDFEDPIVRDARKRQEEEKAREERNRRAEVDKILRGGL